MSENKTTEVFNEEGIEVDLNEKIAHYAGYIRAGALVTVGIIIGGKLEKRSTYRWMKKHAISAFTAASSDVAKAHLNDISPYINGNRLVMVLLKKSK